ncbi:hypothetical protein [Myxococcus phage Mx1]|nr:hypothetical protein [Myxococcus phage Mx1]
MPPLTHDQVQTALDQIQLGHPFKSMNAEFLCKTDDPAIQVFVGQTMVRGVVIRIRVPHRDTGEPIPVHHVVNINRFDDIGTVTWTVYNGLRELFLHEVAEAFLVNGVRVHDPHK